MVHADCLIVVPSEITDIQTGEEVLIQITDGIGD
jgi:molybdopterin biosynthesis enzyme